MFKKVRNVIAPSNAKGEENKKKPSRLRRASEWLNQNMDPLGEYFYGEEMNDMDFGENEYGLKLPGLGKAAADAAAAMKKQKLLIKKTINDNKAQLDPAKKMLNAKIAAAKTNVASLKKNMPNMAGVGEALQNVALAEMLYGAQKKRLKTGKNKNKGPTLKQLQNLARRNKVNIYKMRKDRRGYTKTALTKKALKARLSRSRVSYKNLKAPRTRTRTRTRTRKRYVSSSSTRRACPVGSYRDPYSGNCRKIPKREDLDELDSVNFNWKSDRTFGNKPLSMQYSRYGRSCFGSVPCDCGS